MPDEKQWERAHDRPLSRRQFVRGLAAAAAALLPACRGGSSSKNSDASARSTVAASPAIALATPPRGRTGGKKIVRIAFRADLGTPDPALITGAPAYPVAEAIFDGLARLGYDLPLGDAAMPGLAERWEASDDGKTFTVYLRPGVKYQRDYGEVSAEDVRFNWSRLQDKRARSPYQPDLANATLDVIDARTIRVTLPRPFPGFAAAVLAFCPGLIISPRAFQEMGETWGASPVGSGPFAWNAVEPGVSLTLSRFDGYWGTRPKIDQIVLRFKVDDRTAVSDVAAGKLDAVYVEDPDIARELVRETPSNTVLLRSSADLVPYWIAFNLGKKPLDDVRVRQALRFALDAGAIARDTLGGLATPIASFIPPAMAVYSDRATAYPFDAAKARQLLKEATLPAGWQPVLLADATSPLAAAINAAAAGAWGAVGVRVKIEALDPAALGARRRSGDFDMLSVAPSRATPEQLALHFWHSSAPLNSAGYSGADDLIDQAREAAGDKAKSIYVPLQDKISQDAPAAFIVATEQLLLVNKRVVGISGAGWLDRIDWSSVDVPAE